MALDRTYTQCKHILEELEKHFKDNVYGVTSRIINSNDIYIGTAIPVLEIFTPLPLVWRFVIRNSKLYEETYPEDGRIVVDLGNPEVCFKDVINWFYKDYYEFLASARESKNAKTRKIDDSQ